jgi:hypothetical protein
MAGLPLMTIINFRVHRIQTVHDGAPEMTWCVYDATGNRVRKVTESKGTPSQTSKIVNESVYLGMFEVYHIFNGTGTVNIERNAVRSKDSKELIAIMENVFKDVGEHSITRCQITSAQW